MQHAAADRVRRDRAGAEARAKSPVASAWRTAVLEMRSPLCRKRRHHFELESATRRVIGKQGNVSGTLGAEAEVIADQ